MLEKVGCVNVCVFIESGYPKDNRTPALLTGLTGQAHSPDRRVLTKRRGSPLSTTLLNKSWANFLAGFTLRISSGSNKVYTVQYSTQMASILEARHIDNSTASWDRCLRYENLEFSGRYVSCDSFHTWFAPEKSATYSSLTHSHNGVA